MGYYVDFKELKEYCQSRMRTVIKEVTPSTQNYKKGLYLGYRYGLRLHNLYEGKGMVSTKLYQMIKYRKNQLPFIKGSIDDTADIKAGIKDALYDLMNLVNKQ